MHSMGGLTNAIYQVAGGAVGGGGGGGAGSFKEMDEQVEGVHKTIDLALSVQPSMLVAMMRGGTGVAHSLSDEGGGAMAMVQEEEVLEGVGVAVTLTTIAMVMVMVIGGIAREEQLHLNNIPLNPSSDKMNLQATMPSLKVWIHIIASLVHLKATQLQ